MMTNDSHAPRTHVSVSAVADCPFSIAQEYAEDYLQSAEAGGPLTTIRFPLPAPLPSIGRRVRMGFGLHLDVVEQGRAHDEIRLRWSSGTKLLPDFRGTLRFRIDGNMTLLLLDGHYRAPLGCAGRIFDALIGKYVARATLNDLARRITRYLIEHQHIWLATMSSIPVKESQPRHS